MDLSKMKPPITASQAMAHPAVFETVNSLGKMADELRAEVEALTKERDIAVRKLSALSSAHALENLYQAGLDQEREITRLKKERDALAEQVSFLKTTNEVLAEKLTPPDGWAEAVGLAKIMAQLSKPLSERRAEILAQAILDMDAKIKEQK